jgi:uncharacterized membrane-anchored protein
MLGLPVFAGCMLLASGHRALSLLAALVTLWISGAWYYAAGLPLAHKGLVLISLGLALGALALLAGSRQAGAAAIPVAVAPPRAVTLSLIGLGTAVVAGLAGWNIASNERVLRDGRLVFLRIVPVDPRSLMQGDYMTLAFELPQRRVDPGLRQFGGPQPVAVGTVGPDGVATLTEITLKRPALAGGQIAMALSQKDGAWVVGSDAWFFREGDAARFAAARYGMFRVTPDGTALLAGLADGERRQIR